MANGLGGIKFDAATSTQHTPRVTRHTSWTAPALPCAQVQPQKPTDDSSDSHSSAAAGRESYSFFHTTMNQGSLMINSLWMSNDQ